jgi:hypothetical protein
MTPKEEAERIYSTIGGIIWGSDVAELTTNTPFDRLYIQKQCAILAVDEILESLPSVVYVKAEGDEIKISCKRDFYNKVKQEIQKL